MEQTASMFLFIARSIILIGNYFFSFPSLFLLIMMTIVYFWKDGFPTLNINGLKNYVKSKGFTEIMSFSWLFGTLFGVIFVAIVDRRLSFIIIPLVIYSSLSIYGNKKTYNDLKMRNNTKVNILEYLMVLLLIVSFIINFILFSNKNIFDSLHGIFKFTGDVPNIASLFQIMIHNPYFYYISGMFLGSLGIAFILFKIQKNHANKRLFWGTISLFLIITLSVSGFIKFNTNMFLLTSSYFSPIDLIIISIIISITITIIITTNNNSLFIRIIKNIYILYCISMIIIFSLISPSFSVLEANQMIKQHTIPGDYVMGFSSFGLTIDSGTKALFYIFNYPVNNTVKGSPYELYHPKIYLRPSPEWGNFTDKPFINEIPYTLEYIGTYNLNPFLSYGKPMMQIEAYEIKYVEKKDTIFNYQNNILNNN
ncbi:MAG: hypothetical protein HQ490_04035 [Lutibacter sp.]|nr:hypothetical protein [Lutibacter sp.]